MFGAPIRLPRGFGLGAFDPDVVVLHKKEKLHIFPAPFPPSSQQKKLQCSSLGSLSQTSYHVKHNCYQAAHRPRFSTDISYV